LLCQLWEMRHHQCNASRQGLCERLKPYPRLNHSGMTIWKFRRLHLYLSSPKAFIGDMVSPKPATTRSDQVAKSPIESPGVTGGGGVPGALHLNIFPFANLSGVLVLQHFPASLPPLRSTILPRPFSPPQQQNKKAATRAGKAAFAGAKNYSRAV